jgi:hypothetical protein
MTSTSNDRLSVTLLVLRMLVLGVFLMWTLEKFVNPERAAGIYEMGYSIRPGVSIILLMAVLELMLLAAFLAGIGKRLTRGVLLGMMVLATIAPARFLPTPFDDHILLYYAAFPMLAVVFALYYLRDYDTLWTAPGAAPRELPAGRLPADDPRVALCLLLIRLGVFFVLFMWTMDKFIHPLQTSRILAGFYNIGGQDPLLGLPQVSYESVYLLGAIEVVLILAFLLGIAKRFTYAVIFALHALSTVAPWARFLQPFTAHTLLFFASFAMLGGCFALYYLREHDVLGVWRPGRARASFGATLAAKAGDRPAQIWAVAVIVAAAYVLFGNAREWRHEKSNGPAIVAELRQRFVPSDQLLGLNPEMATAKWTPMWRSANCTFTNPTIRNCWELHFIVWVPEVPGNVMRGRRQVEANWIVDADALRFLPDGSGNRYFRRTTSE